MAGCSAANITGVSESGRGVPVITNCGTWISGVVARDARTDRVIWSAGMTARSRQEHDGVWRLDLGQLPRPVVWIFVVDTGLAKGTTLRLHDADLARGRSPGPVTPPCRLGLRARRL